MLRLGARHLLATLVILPGIVLADDVAAATPAPFGSQELYRWMARTAAKALKASDANDDLRRGGLFALNSSARRGLEELEDMVPRWVAGVDARLSFSRELAPSYGLSARREVYEHAAHDLTVAAFGSVDIHHDGKGTGEIGLSMITPVAGEAFRIDLASGLEQQWLRERERRTWRLDLDWWRLRLKSSMFDERTMAEEVGAAYEDRFLDGYQIDLSTAVPHATWLRLGAWHRHLAPATHGATANDHTRLSLRLTPIRGLLIETGTGRATGSERRWFGRLRYKITLGG